MRKDIAVCLVGILVSGAAAHGAPPSNTGSASPVPVNPMVGLNREQRASDAAAAFISAAREFEQERHVEAFDLFRQAEMLDRGIRRLGAGPIVGQLRCLLALQRHKEALSYMPALLRRPVRENGVAEALILTASAARALGDERSATKLYQRASRGPAPQAAEARAGLTGMKRSKRTGGSP